MAIRDWLLPVATPERFARRVARILRRAKLDGRVRVMLRGVQYAGPPTGENVVNLENLYLDYRNVPRRGRGGIFDVIVQMARRADADRQTSPDDARTRLLPMVRDALFFALLDPLAAASDGFKGPVTRPMNDELSCGLCIDYDESIVTVNADELARLGLSEDEAHRVARENLGRRSDAPFATIVPGLFVSNFGDYHDAGRLALPQLLARLDVRGEVVVAVPNRLMILATGANDAENLTRICKVAEEQITTQPRPMTGALFRLANFEWQPWLPPMSNPARAAARRLALIGRANQYSGQRDALVAALAKAGVDRFIAAQPIVQRKADGALFTWCAWPPDVTDGSLPESDLIAMGEGAAPRFACWADAIRVAGHRLTRDPCGGPRRWLFTTSPSTDEMAAMPTLDLDDAEARLDATRSAEN